MYIYSLALLARQTGGRQGHSIGRLPEPIASWSSRRYRGACFSGGEPEDHPVADLVILLALRLYMGSVKATRKTGSAASICMQSTLAFAMG